MSMMQLTVKTLTGVEEQFIDVDETSTVGAFNAVVATRTEFAVEVFRMYRGGTYLPQCKTLKDAQVVDGTKLTMYCRQTNQCRAEARVNKLGVRPTRGGAAHSIKHDILPRTFVAVNCARDQIRAGTEDVLDGLAGVDQKQDEMAADIKAIKNVLMGEEVPRHAGQSDKARMKHIRNVKHFGNNELVDIREREDNRIAAGKRAASTQLRELAEVAEGSVTLAVGDMTREQLKLDYQNKLKAVAARDKLAAKREKETIKRLSQAANGPVDEGDAALQKKRRGAATSPKSKQQRKKKEIMRVRMASDEEEEE